jgi:hypothetical protein
MADSSTPAIRQRKKEKMGPAWRGCSYGSLSSLSNARHAVWWGWQFNWLGDAQYVGFFGGSFPNNDITHASSTIFCSMFNSAKQCSCSYCAKDQSGNDSVHSSLNKGNSVCRLSPAYTHYWESSFHSSSSLCVFLLPISSVLIWEFLFDLRISFHLVLVSLIMNVEIS